MNNVQLLLLFFFRPPFNSLAAFVVWGCLTFTTN